MKTRDVLLEVEIDLPGGHEGAHALDFELQAALVHAGDDAFDDLADLQVLPRHVAGPRRPCGGGSAGLRARRSARRRIPSPRRPSARLELQLGDDALALAAEVDEHVVLADVDHLARAAGPWRRVRRRRWQPRRPMSARALPRRSGFDLLDG